VYTSNVIVRCVKFFYTFSFVLAFVYHSISREKQRLKEYFRLFSPLSYIKVKLVRCCPEDDEFTEMFDEEFEIYRKYQIVIHHDKEDEVDKKQVYSIITPSETPKGPKESFLQSFEQHLSKSHEGINYKPD